MKNTKQTYLAPAVEVMEITVEQGFNGSIDKDPTRPGENPEMPDVDDEW